MTEVRREYAQILDERLRDIASIDLLKESPDCYWNYQYYVIRVPSGMDKIFQDMFSRGIHLMKEDVWDCTSYEFGKGIRHECPVALAHNPGLIRIQNNSLMNQRDMQRISQGLRASALKVF